MKTAIIAAMVTLMSFSQAWAYQDKEQFGPPERGDNIVEKVSQRLELKDFQKERLERFAEAMRNMRESRKQDRGQHRQELLGLLDASALDRVKAMELLDAKHQEFKRHMGELVETFADFSDSLDAGQREELKAILAQRMERRRERRHRAH